MDQNTEAILAAAAEAKEVPATKRSKEQIDVIRQADKIMGARSQAATNLRYRRKTAENSKVDIGSSVGG